MARSFVLLVLLVMLLRIDLAATKSPKKRTATITNGQGGATCSKSICLAGGGIVCGNSNKCLCPGGRSLGDGVLECHRPYENVCKLISDPKCHSFSGEATEIAASCKMRLTTVKTKAMTGGMVVGECVMEVMAWGAKGRGFGSFGKHYIGGIEVQFSVILDDDSLHYHSTRIYGWAESGEYKYIEEGTKSLGASGGYGPNITTIIPDVGVIKTVYDYDNNIVEVRANFCGTRVGFRAPEKHVDKQNPRFMPGVFIKVNEKYGPRYITPETSMCMAPKKENVTLDNLVEMIKERYQKSVSKAVALMFIILKMGPDQEFPNVPPLLKAMARIFTDCSDRAALCALESCWFITRVPKFFRCWTRPGRKVGQEERDGDQGERGQGRGQGGDEEDEEEGEDEDEKEELRHQKHMSRALHLMLRCMSSFCNNSKHMCKKVKKSIRFSGCIRYAPRWGIINYDCNQFE